MKSFWLRVILLALSIATSSSIKPKIIEEPKDTTVLQGEDVTLRCVVEYLPAKDLTPVQWTRGDFALGYDRNLSDWERYSMAGDFSIGEYNLHIKNTDVMEDEHEYECQVTEYLLRTKKATLTVVVPPTGPFVEGRETDKATIVNVVVGKENFITCRAIGGKPAANLHWYRNGIEIFNEVTSAVTGPEGKLYNTSSTLRITPTQRDADATYACVMTSDELPDNQFGRKLVKLNMLKPPIVSVAIPLSIEEGDFITADCRVVADPPVLSYRWYIDGEEQDGKISSSINIGFANETWHGKTVGCDAMNKGGYSKRNEAEINVLYAPIFVGGSDRVTAEIGDNVTLWCKWDSNPVPTVHWVREGDPSFVWSSETLELNNVDQFDEGRYVCHAKAGNMGTNKATTELSVHGPPIFNYDQKQYAILGEDSIIHCSITSSPGISQVTWTWTHEGTEFTLLGNQSLTSVGSKASRDSSAKYHGRFTPGEQSAQLMITGTIRDDLHLFSCSISNSYGIKSMEIMLEEDMSNAANLATIGVAVGGSVAGLFLLLVILILACCYRRFRRQSKSTNFDKEKLSNKLVGQKNYSKEDATPINHTNQVDGAKVYNTRGSVSSRDDEPASTLSGSDASHPTPTSGQDDGYHTEEASSWNRRDGVVKVSAASTSPTKSFPKPGYFVDLPPPLETIEYKKPLLNNNQYASGDSYTEYPPRTTSLNQHPYSQIPYDPTTLSQPVSNFRSNSALSERMSPPAVRYIHRNYSDVAPVASSQYAPAPLDYYTQSSHSGMLPMQPVTDHPSYPDSPSYGPSIPINSRDDTYFQMPVQSSQSSLDKFDRESALSASAVAVRNIDLYDNAAGRRSNMSSRMSQSSRSSEFVRPFIARMATHV